MADLVINKAPQSKKKKKKGSRLTRIGGLFFALGLQSVIKKVLYYVLGATLNFCPPMPLGKMDINKQRDTRTLLRNTRITFPNSQEK